VQHEARSADPEGYRDPSDVMRSNMRALLRLGRSAALLLVLVSATCDSTSPMDVVGDCTDNPRQAVLDLVNDLRVDDGLAPLVMDLRLALAAQGHSEDMTRNDFMSHTGSDGSSAGERITAAGYPWTSWSENVAAGQPTPEAVVSAWMNSPGHRANILRAASEHVGIGYDHAGDTTYGHYWTMNFGASDQDPATGTGCHP